MTHGLSILHGTGVPIELSEFTTLQVQGKTISDPLTILDPLDISRNVTRSAYRVSEIQLLFQDCLRYLEVNCHSIVQENDDSNIIDRLIPAAFSEIPL